MARNLCAPTVLLCFATAAGSVWGQTSSPPVAPQSQTLQVELTKTVRANKAKVGDVVRARTVTALILDGRTAISEGSKLLGRVLRAERPSAGSTDSSLTIAFDELQPKRGRALRANFSIRAARLPQLTVHAQPDAFAGAPSSSWTPYASPHKGLILAPESPHNTTSQPDVAPESQILKLDYNRGDLRSAREGTLIGMPGVTLRVDEASGAATFRSSNRKLELKSGLQLALRVVSPN